MCSHRTPVFGLGFLVVFFILTTNVAPAQAARGYWIPPGVDTIRGIIMEFNSYSGLGKAVWKEFATQHGFAMVGGGGPLIAPASPGYESKNYDSVDIYLKFMADESGHPEIVNAPLCTYGGSRGGWWALQVADKKPLRAIGTVGGYCGMWRNNAGYPVTFPINELDKTFFNDKTVFQDMQDGFFPNRKNGALWSAAVIWGDYGHGVANIDDLMIPYFDRLIQLRLPDSQSTITGPLTLNTIKETDGWLSNFYQSKSHMPPIASYDQFGYAKEYSCWFPDENFAWVWRAFVSMTPLVKITSPQRSSVLSNGTVEVGAEALSDTLAIQKVEFYDANVKLGEVTEAPFRITTCLSPGVHSLIAIATSQGTNGIRTCSKPATVIVKKDAPRCSPASVKPDLRKAPSSGMRSVALIAGPGTLIDNNSRYCDIRGRSVSLHRNTAGSLQNHAPGVYLSTVSGD